jgi:hypothetical protein
MIVSATQVSTLCNSSELLLVRASRQPELHQLSHADLKRLTIRARKLADKWLDQSRSASRKLNRQAGSGAPPRGTKLKAQIFSDALKSLTARLAQFEGTPAVATSQPKTKKSRNASHRKTRAKVRKALARH